VKSTNSDQELFMADLIILNGNVITLDAQFSIVKAVAIKGDKIVATGSTDDIKRLACKKTRILDLKGATMLPGFNDSHCHISDWALSRPPLMLDVRYPVVKSIADIVDMVREKALKAKHGEWIQ
jgi:predicted amidohydrolase YtcJ